MTLVRTILSCLALLAAASCYASTIPVTDSSVVLRFTQDDDGETRFTSISGSISAGGVDFLLPIDSVSSGRWETSETWDNTQLALETAEAIKEVVDLTGAVISRSPIDIGLESVELVEALGTRGPKEPAGFGVSLPIVRSSDESILDYELSVGVSINFRLEVNVRHNVTISSPRSISIVNVIGNLYGSGLSAQFLNVEGSLELAPYKSMTIGANNVPGIPRGMSNSGEVRLGSGSLSLSAPFVNDGLITSKYGSLTGSSYVLNEGTWKVNGSSSVSGQLAFWNEGTIDLERSMWIKSSSTFVDAGGSLSVGSKGGLYVQGRYTNSGSNQLRASGSGKVYFLRSLDLASDYSIGSGFGKLRIWGRVELNGNDLLLSRPYETEEFNAEVEGGGTLVNLGTVGPNASLTVKDGANFASFGAAHFQGVKIYAGSSFESLDGLLQVSGYVRSAGEFVINGGVFDVSLARPTLSGNIVFASGTVYGGSFPKYLNITNLDVSGLGYTPLYFQSGSGFKFDNVYLQEAWSGYPEGSRITIANSLFDMNLIHSNEKPLVRCSIGATLNFQTPSTIPGFDLVYAEEGSMKGYYFVRSE